MSIFILLQEKLGSSEANIEHKRNDLGDPDIGNCEYLHNVILFTDVRWYNPRLCAITFRFSPCFTDLLNGSNQVDEQNSEDKAVAIETEGRQDGKQ